MRERFKGPHPILSSALLFCAALMSGCSEEVVPEKYRPTDAHDAYRHALQEAGLSGTALGRDWMQAASNAIEDATAVEAPFQEALYIDPATAFAAGYRFPVRQGQRIEVDAQLQGALAGRLFIDLFRVVEDSEPVQVASAPEDDPGLEFEPRRDGEYIVRLQSELLRGGQLTVTIVRKASLEFPVAGHSVRSIQSGFGATRDGGRREHHGVDIFAARHTPVLAPSRAYVSRVAERGRGGRVIWLRDQKRSLSLYFAHLQTQSVEEGAWVEPGDEIGTVGNSGNARTTPPHLHFGIYMRGRGPLDPESFVRQPRLKPSDITVSLDLLGKWSRSSVSSAPIYATPDRRAETIFVADRYTPMKILGGTAGYYRVSLPDGTSGFVRARAVELAARPIGSRRLAADQVLLSHPSLGAPSKGNLAPGLELQVLGSFRSYEWVQAPGGNTGWLAP
ncbi:MAG: M23 family metallopeptidase [Acidobacteriota bacterium]